MAAGLQADRDMGRDAEGTTAPLAANHDPSVEAREGRNARVRD
jgi:hypothetical protein